jgi:adenosylcobyric acid synthase
MVQAAGTCIQGLFDHPRACRALPIWAGVSEPVEVDREAPRERAIDRLTDSLEQHPDTAAPLPQSWCA